MKRERILIASLVVAHLLLHAFVVGTVLPHFPAVVAGPPFRAPGFFWKVMFWVGPSQGALFALWIALGGKRTVRRILLAVAVVIVYMSCFRHVDYEWLTSTIGQTVVLTPLLLLARLTGLELTRSVDSQAAPRRFQFSIWDMFVWTTVLAVVLSALEYLSGKRLLTPAHSPVAIEPNPILRLLVVLMLVNLPSIWAALGRRWIIARILSLPVVIGLTAAVIIPPSWWRPYYIHCTIALSSVSAWLVVSLAVVRLAGYHLTWRWRFSRKRPGSIRPDEHAPPESTDVKAGKPVGQAPSKGRLH